jgi:hypothetical protein
MTLSLFEMSFGLPSRQHPRSPRRRLPFSPGIQMNRNGLRNVFHGTHSKPPVEIIVESSGANIIARVKAQQVPSLLMRAQLVEPAL